MKRSLIAPGLLLLLSAGCFDKQPVNPEAKRRTVEIQSNSVSLEEQTIPEGSTLQLSAVLKDAAGKPISGTSFDWRSTAPEVASVQPGGLVTAKSVGTALVIASAGANADTARINVARPISGEVACAPGDGGLGLAVGEVHTTTGDKATTLCLQGGVGGAEYTYIPFNASDTATASLPLSVASSGVVAVVGPPTPSLQPLLPAPDTRLLPDMIFHERLLERSRQAMEPRLRAGGLTPSQPQMAAVPGVGDLLRLNTDISSNNGCGTPNIRTGRVAAVTTRAIVVADTSNPKGGFTDEDYRHFGATFDTLVWRVATQNFGEPSDIDENGRVLIFFTRAVNELTATNSDSYVGGFFFNRDLFPKTGSNSCTGSNYAEMFYMLAPDPNGEVNKNVRSTAFVRNNTVGVLAHEFQHLINDSRRLYVNKALVWEKTWLNEGLSHIAEELMFYAASGLAPRQNIGPSALGNSRTVTAFNQYSADNVARLMRYLRDPEAATLIGKDSLPTRGAAWSFLRYTADRVNGSDDAVLWKRLVNSTTQGLPNLQSAIGANPRDWIQDWTVAIYTDDAGLPLRDAARFTQPSWNFRALMPVLRVNQVPVGRYPLKTTTLSSGAATSFTLQGGGAAYLRIGVPAGQKAAVRTAVTTAAGPMPPPSLLRMSIVRTK